MGNINNLSEQELLEIGKLTNQEVDSIQNSPKKQGFLKTIFSRKKKMSKDNTEQPNTTQEEVKTTENVEVQNNDKDLKEQIKEVIEEPNQIPEPPKVNLDINDGEPVVEEPINEQVVEQIKYDVKEQMEKEEIKKSFNETNEPSKFKTATFTIKVKNNNVGNVLSKIGEYATQLDQMEEVEHCDLNIIDTK